MAFDREAQDTKGKVSTFTHLFATHTRLSLLLLKE